MTALTTCQICARAIKASTSLIAHHGYQRPHQQGWQTSSCFGARWRPYEVACDALPPAIKSAEFYKIDQETALSRWLAEPPTTIKWQRNGAYGPRGPEYVFEIPADFDVNGKDYCGKLESYTWQYRKTRNGFRARITQATSDIVELKKRLADWRAP